MIDLASQDALVADALVLYEYAVKPPKRVSANFRWAILRDGQYLVMQNPEESLRPLDASDAYWYEAEWVMKRQLPAEQLDAVRKAVAQAPFTTQRVSPPQPSPRGEWARLTLRGDAGMVRFEVEDGATAEHENWIGKLLLILAPSLAGQPGS